MIKFFNTGYITRYLLLLILIIVLWLPSLINPIAYSGISSLAYDQISIFVKHNLFILTFCSFILTILTALILNKIASENGFSSKISTLVAFLYIVLTSTIYGEIHNNPAIWINFILVFVLANLLKLPYTNYTILIVFNASFMLGIASLFYSQLVLLVAFIWLSIVIHKVVTWRNFAVTIIGVLLPYLYLLTWFFFTDNMLENSFVLFDSLQLDLTPIFVTEYSDILASVVLLTLIIISGFGIAGKLYEKNINLRRNLIIVFFYILSVFLILLLFSKSLISVLLLSIPSALILGHWLSNIKKVKWYNIALIFTLIIITINQYLVIISRV